MKNKRGFTLVEMLGVLIILIMVFMIVFPSLTKVIKETNEKIDSATVSIIEEATASYLSEKSDLYPKGDDYTYCITLTDLIDNANLTEKQISSLDDKNMIVKTTFSNTNPTYVLTKTCTPVVVDIDFTLTGQKNMSFEVGDGGQYVEPGATALNKAGETVSYTVTITNSKKETIAYVDTTKVDIYTVKYSATIDGEDYSIERIVKVVDTTAPIITVNPTSETIAITNSTYNVLAGVTASDNSGDIPTIKASTNLSLGQAGTYTVNYTATDSSGNKKTAKRTVIISNSSLVSITLLGNKTVNYYINSGAYTDVGATAVDNLGNNLTSSLVTTIIKNGIVVSTVEVDKKATYYITYSIIKDGVNYSETRIVNVVDYTVYANGTAVYFNPVTGVKCTSGEAVSTTGTKTGCMKWYTFNDGGSAATNINMILDHNTTAVVAWNSTGNNTAGPTNVLTQLQTDTASWSNTLSVDSSNNITQQTNSSSTNYTLNYSGYKARLITGAEVALITGNTSWTQANTASGNYFLDTNTTTPSATCTSGNTTNCKFGWLYDRTSTSCTTYGCLNNADAAMTGNGYWTSSAHNLYPAYAWRILKNNLFNHDSISSATDVGVRPVITISKKLLD